MACACKILDCKLGGSTHTTVHGSTRPRDGGPPACDGRQAPTTPDTQPAPVVPLRSTLAAAAWRTAETDNERERERVKQTANSSEASMCVAAHSSFFLFSWREPTVRDGALDIALSLCCPAEAPPPVLPVSKCYVLEAPEAVLRQ